MGTPLPSKEDPIYAAIGCKWPREVIIHMLPKKKVEKKLLASGHISLAGTWLVACTRIEYAALRGLPLPPEAEVVHKILREYSPEDL